jgi:hypothetical protein
MRFKRILVTILFMSVLAAEGMSAQATGTPTFFAPTRGFGDTEVGVSFSGASGSGGVGVEGRYGFSLNNSDISLRAGYVDPGDAGSGSFVAGVEARIPVIGHDRRFPLDGAFILGVGHSFSDAGGETFVPVGLSLGRRIVLDGNDLQITPYVQPTVIFQDDSVFGAGLGLDLHIRGVPDIRFNWTVGDLNGFSGSLFWAR